MSSSEMKSIEVVAAIIRDGDKIFATQRGYGPWKDWWEFPGGKIEPGETPEQALVGESLHLNEHEAARWLSKDDIHAVKWLPADEGLLPIIVKEL